MAPQTYILFSLAADAILIAILLFLWARQRSEWHALLWAGGQLALSLGSASWVLGEHASMHYLIAATSLCGAVAGFVGGTEYFLGKLQRRHLRPLMLACGLGVIGLYGLWEGQPLRAEWLTATMLGVAMVWSGLRLAMHRNRYRFLGMALVVRGLYNLANSLGWIPPDYESWFVYSIAIKTTCVLCLIHAVQEKIRHRYVHTIDSLSSGFLIHDGSGLIQVANERCATLLGRANAAALIGTHVVEQRLFESRDAAAAYFRRFEAAHGAYPFIETATIALENSQRVPLELIASPYIESGQLYCMVQLFDISERQKKDALLHRAAHHDPVTGLLNRHGLIQALELLLQQARPGDCALFFIDLDRFKRINDTFGHETGDHLLCQFAQRLQGPLPANALVARFGGDEFIIVLPCAGEAMARMVGQRILDAVATPFSLPQQALSVSASIGVACHPQHGASADVLIRNADIAMYEAKKTGRSQLRFFDDDMTAHAREALIIDGALREAIARDELRLLYQPIVTADGGRLRKVEALLRWHSAQLGTVPPDRFIAVAEDSELIVDLGHWVLRQACRQLAQWDGAMGELVISINVSARQLLDSAFIDQVRSALDEHQLPARRLELELTERVLLDDTDKVQVALSRLSALGVSLSLDDFGTGYSSLAYLARFRLDTLKIDRSFVMQIEHGERGHNLAATIVSMGRSLGMEVVAEGVETAQQAAILQAMGCHYLQGYHIARPMEAQALALSFSASGRW
ncbi:putative bifunctional diguanylate cyclase/phosphodiesterase [Janthinobacterium psychrotolerans]|uniref:Diguanylate cyclase (GGDEF) domain-containing protein n=1 Tax=Janthinobacterium psychrotolerans TaxID=1747903 RepID=A0A1A7C0Y1_9BURK|nr:EAL domain-containing protein [Janthinobacterium psychrotolerans]OBV37963.1 diguanylate cyclase (GGDEF) domain-containing protein [Janthinobacterium psychrotolerans]